MDPLHLNIIPYWLVSYALLNYHTRNLLLFHTLPFHWSLCSSRPHPPVWIWLPAGWHRGPIQTQRCTLCHQISSGGREREREKVGRRHESEKEVKRRVTVQKNANFSLNWIAKVREYREVTGCANITWIHLEALPKHYTDLLCHVPHCWRVLHSPHGPKNALLALNALIGQPIRQQQHWLDLSMLSSAERHLLHACRRAEGEGGDWGGS